MARIWFRRRRQAMAARFRQNLHTYARGLEKGTRKSEPRGGGGEGEVRWAEERVKNKVD
jgi:hypothetical protein